MKNYFVLVLVLSFSIITLSLVLSSNQDTEIVGNYHTMKNWGKNQDNLRAESRKNQYGLQAPEALYKNMFIRCQDEASRKAQICNSEYEKELTECGTNEKVCRALNHRNACLMFAMNSKANCARLANNVLHDLR